MKACELSGPWLDYFVAKAEGYRMVRVGYEGGEDETTEQKDLPDWFWTETDNSVGCYWMRAADKSVMDAADPSGKYETPWGSPYSPSTSWAHGGPLIERERIGVQFEDPIGGIEVWGAGWRGSYPKTVPNDWHHGFGPTPLIAAMRAYVASKFGEEVVDNP